MSRLQTLRPLPDFRKNKRKESISPLKFHERAPDTMHTFPYCNPATAVRIPAPGSVPVRIHDPSYPAPQAPVDRCDRADLNARLEWSSNIGLNKRISPRMQGFVTSVYKPLLEEFESERDAKRKSNLAGKIKKHDEFLQTIFEELGGEDGLCATVMRLVAHITVCKMRMAWGDYLALDLSRIKQTIAEMDPELKKNELWDGRLHCNHIAARIEAERKLNVKWHMNFRDRDSTPMPETPTLYACQEAERCLSRPSESVSNLLVLYAMRCEVAHSGISELLEDANSRGLGVRLVEDLRELSSIPAASRGWEAQAYLEELRLFRDEYFVHLRFDDDFQLQIVENEAIWSRLRADKEKRTRAAAKAPTTQSVAATPHKPREGNFACAHLELTKYI